MTSDDHPTADIAGPGRRVFRFLGHVWIIEWEKRCLVKDEIVSLTVMLGFLGLLGPGCRDRAGGARLAEQETQNHIEMS